MAQSTRAGRKSKRRKTNRILNTAIAVVVLLIIIVGFTIFSGGEKEEVSQPPVKKEETQQPAGNEEDEQPADIEADTTSQVEEEEEEKDEQEAVVEKESDEPNVEKEITNPNWTGAGTSQSGQHTSSFDTSSVDWQEKTAALSYATGIPQEEMTVWYISGDGPKGAIGTVSPKSDKNDAYRVYISWVDGEGWKPTKVYKLKHNDKGR
ncbi:DUF1510 family protein [Bacillus sp. B190/17]|uniref:DUF1510 family protein n=1 Tax=Bacillus lumedeiriae TaxID=3058829 RepID=A0ABW8I6U3_9BACI